MSKKSKAASKQMRLNKKRAIKTSNKARYAALKLQGENTKSKRALKNGKESKLVNKTDHTTGNCGNIGCKKCTIIK